MKNFDEHIASKTFIEIMELVLDACKNPVTKLNLNTFGRGYNIPLKSCYACAATNLMLKECKVNPEKVVSIFALSDRTKLAFGNDVEWGSNQHMYYDFFEEAIDQLRHGFLTAYILNVTENGNGKMPLPNDFEEKIFISIIGFMEGVDPAFDLSKSSYQAIWQQTIDEMKKI